MKYIISKLYIDISSPHLNNVNTNFHQQLVKINIFVYHHIYTIIFYINITKKKISSFFYKLD